MIYAHNDPSGWGKQFVLAAGRAGIDARLFKRADEVPEGARAFVRLDQIKERREDSKRLVQALSARGVITLPRPIEAHWYDDKLAQVNALADHLPDTAVLKTREAAMAAVSSMDYPFISKSSEGSASRGVRLIKNPAQAKAEINAAFGRGLQTGVYDRVQKGYLYWQEFVPDNPCDYRVINCGRHWFGAVRGNRDDVPFASGSGINAPIMDMDARTKAAFEKCRQVGRELETQWMAFDVIFKGDVPLVVEISSAWPPHFYATAQAFTCPGESLFIKAEGKTGGHMFDFAVQALCAE